MFRHYPPPSSQHCCASLICSTILFQSRNLMLIRIVKMTFQPQNIPTFLENFEENKEKIRSFEGCQHLELWQETEGGNVLFTYSHWDAPQSLENYRNSPLFKTVWAFTKTLFADKPEAWSFTPKHILK